MRNFEQPAHTKRTKGIPSTSTLQQYTREKWKQKALIQKKVFFFQAILLSFQLLME